MTCHGAVQNHSTVRLAPPKAYALFDLLPPQLLPALDTHAYTTTMAQVCRGQPTAAHVHNLNIIHASYSHDVPAAQHALFWHNRVHLQMHVVPKTHLETENCSDCIAGPWLQQVEVKTWAGVVQEKACASVLGQTNANSQVRSTRQHTGWNTVSSRH